MTVRAGPLVLLWGNRRPALICSMAEMVGWISNLKDTGEGFPGDTLKAAMLGAKTLGATPAYKISLLSFEEKKTGQVGAGMICPI